MDRISFQPNKFKPTWCRSNRITQMYWGKTQTLLAIYIFETELDSLTELGACLKGDKKNLNSTFLLLLFYFFHDLYLT